jgi:hypothetical protein
MAIMYVIGVLEAKCIFLETDTASNNNLLEMNIFTKAFSMHTICSIL